MFPLIASTMAIPSPKEEHLCRFHVKRASLVTFEVLILALFLERTNVSKDMEKGTRLV